MLMRSSYRESSRPNRYLSTVIRRGECVYVNKLDDIDLNCKKEPEEAWRRKPPGSFGLLSLQLKRDLQVADLLCTDMRDVSEAAG